MTILQDYLQEYKITYKISLLVIYHIFGGLLSEFSKIHFKLSKYGVFSKQQTKSGSGGLADGVAGDSGT